MGRKLAAALCALLILTGCAQTGTGAPADLSEPEKDGAIAVPGPEESPQEPQQPQLDPAALSGYPYNATLAWPEMNEADFWIALAEKPQAVRMTAEEIAGYNAGLFGLPGTDVEDLSAWPEALTAARLRELVTKYPEAPDEGAYTDGGKLTGEQRQVIRENRNLGAIQPENPVRYGFASQNLILRSYPSPLPVYSGADSGEYDLAAETALKIWEPVLVLHTSADGRWLLVRAYDYLGWAAAEDVALCQKPAWDSLRQQLSSNFLTVLAPRLAMEGSFSVPEQENLVLKMGTRLPLANGSEADNASAENCHLVQLPVRREDGTLALASARIPTQADVTVGALPFTTENLLRQVFRLLGSRYGWGGTVQGWDCSSLCQDVYRTMGFDLPRNSGSQSRMTGSIGLESASSGEKTEIISALPPGGMLEMPGHQTMVLGSWQGEIYLIHSTHGVYDSQGRFFNANSVIVTSAAALRPNGRSLLENSRSFSLPDAGRE